MSRRGNEKTEVITCRGLNKSGQGVGSLADGLTVFVDGLIPGEKAEVRIKTRKKSYAVGQIVHLIEGSAERVEPFCAVFPRCGGCSLQHIDYKAQLRYKADQVREAFIRIGGFPELEIQALLPTGSMAKASPSTRHYRAKSQMPVGGDASDPKIGFYESGTHRIVDSDFCPIQDQSADLARQVLRKVLKGQLISTYDETRGEGLLRHLVVRSGKATKDVMLILVLNIGQKQFENLSESDDLMLFIKAFHQEINDVLKSEGYNLSAIYINHHTVKNNLIMSYDFSKVVKYQELREEINGLTYLISPGAFFQVNPEQTEALYEAAVHAAGLDESTRIFDLYCGTGSISLQLAREVASVKGCEIVAAAIEDAKANAELNGLDNVEFVSGKAEVLVPQWVSQGEKADVIVLDPPRKGVEASLVETLRKSAAQRIVYVSCDPATLARDCKLICAEGLYELKSIAAFDMFPHSTHVESVVLITRVKD